MDSANEQSLRLAEMVDDYKSVGEYIRERKKPNYVQFDYDVTHGLTLFMLDPDFSFEALEQTTDVILNALPAIKRIFAQPFIHLKEQDVILPVEAVRKVNNATLTHIASHSELWTDVKEGEIMPAKLLTRTYEDNYGIYENLVFCNVVDGIISYARANARFLRELLYTNRAIEINLLERVNHLNYFLALGKLHIGYSKNFDSYYAVAVRSLNKLQFILNTIVPRLKRPVYKNNGIRPVGLKLHKTNILSMHKEYHRIYKLARFMSRRGEAPIKQVTDDDIAELKRNYFAYCRALCIFSIGHFNFVCDETAPFDIERSTISFTFKHWTLDLRSVTGGKRRLISLSARGGRPYKVVLIPSLEKDNGELLRTVKCAVKADEYIVCTPYESCEKGEAFIDITSIESFRRLQQIVLRMMVYSNKKRTECPFCSNKLTVNDEKSVGGDTVYECNSCRTEIHEARCAQTGEPYYYTAIAGFHPQRSDEDDWLSKRRAESAMYFRNIIDIDSDGEPICPHCGDTHN